MDELDKFKKDTFDRYELALALNGDEICKEIDSVLSDDLDLIRIKAHCYCVFYANRKNGVDSKLYEKCRKYLDHERYYEKKTKKMV